MVKLCRKCQPVREDEKIFDTPHVFYEKLRQSSVRSKVQRRRNSTATQQCSTASATTKINDHRQCSARGRTRKRNDSERLPLWRIKTMMAATAISSQRERNVNTQPLTIPLRCTTQWPINANNWVRNIGLLTAASAIKDINSIVNSVLSTSFTSISFFLLINTNDAMEQTRFWAKLWTSEVRENAPHTA